MSKEKTPARGKYGEVVSRLQEIVSQLEGGELTLEDSIERFQEGIRLVKEGETILADADKKIEQLLSEDGKTAPLKLSDAPTPVATTSVAPAPAPKKPAPAGSEEDDVPF
ncbi:MAG: exodeoxyribonuclease VII small subunit [Archangium sp.]|nr:exodeoxyribonuclease VII small subunit [Archangium sp.]